MEWSFLAAFSSKERTPLTDMPKSGKRLGLKDKLLLMAVSSAIGLIIAVPVAEIVLRSNLRSDYARYVEGFNTGTNTLYYIVPGSPLCYRSRPASSFVWSTHPDGSPLITYRNDAGGFRRNSPEADDVDPERAHVRKRVIHLGDSFTYGWDVQDHETFAAQLEKKVQDLESLNFGVIGYNTVQQEALLREILPKYSPDLVVLNFYINDANPPSPGMVRIDPDRLFRDSTLWIWEEAKDQANSIWEMFIGGRPFPESRKIRPEF